MIYLTEWGRIKLDQYKNNRKQSQPKVEPYETDTSSNCKKMQEALKMLREGVPASVICKSLELSPSQIKNLNLVY